MGEVLSLIQVVLGAATLIATVWAARAKTLVVTIRFEKGADPPPHGGEPSKESED